MTAPPALEWLSARQRDRCFYCGCETWLPRDRRLEPLLRARWNMPASRSMACQIAFECRMASIEHLRRRSEGGTSESTNLAMACAFCNSSRAAATPDAHRGAMRALAAEGRHPSLSADGEAPIRPPEP